MELESRTIELLERIGIRRGQTVLDFGCGYGAYTIPVARIVGIRIRKPWMLLCKKPGQQA